MKEKDKFRLTGIIGNPLKQTMSPLLHNYWIKKNKIKSYYIPIEIENLNNIHIAIRKINFIGMNVTIPYKKQIISYLDEIEEEAKKLQAVNTIINKEGKLVGTNTDIIGFQKGLEKTNYWNKKKPVVIIGAGGATESIVYALSKHNLKEIYVINRTEKRAKKLAEKHSKVFCTKWLDYNIINNSGLIINSTSLGMTGHQELPITLKNVEKDTIIYDIVYNPLQTGFIKKALRKKLQTITGLDMFIGQALESFKLWFSKTPKMDGKILKDLKTAIEKK